MRKILNDVPVAGRRFSLRAGGAPGTEAALAPAARTASARPDATPVPAAPVPSAADEAQLRQWREAAEREGFEAGKRQAAAELKAQAEQEFTRLGELCDSLRQAHDAQRREAQAFAVEFAFTLATRMLASATATPEGARALVDAALASLGPIKPLSLRVHPRDAGWLRQLLAARPGCESVRVEGDPSVTGGCMLEAAQGTLDARLESQCQALKNALLAAHGAAVSSSGAAE